MLHKDTVKISNSTNLEAKDAEEEEEEEEGLQTFFNNPFLTFVKTCTMFVGELEFSDIPINLESSLMPFSYFYFLLFVILIVVVLMNLLNGLAVSDIRMIQDKAETYAYLSIVDTISYAESLLLGDPFDFLSNVPVLSEVMRIPSLSCCRQIYRSKLARRVIHRLTGAQDILLFYNFLPDKCLRTKPNLHRNSCLRIENLNSEIIDASKKIILKKNKQSNFSNVDELMKSNENLKIAVSDLKSQLDEQNRKLDMILKKITT